MMDGRHAVDAYLAERPDGQQRALRRLRERIAERYPDATEHIRYGEPWFKLDGRPFVGLGAARNHCSLYVWSDQVIDRISHLTGDLDTAQSTIRFVPEEPLGDDVLDAVLDARAAELRPET